MQILTTGCESIERSHNTNALGRARSQVDLPFASPTRVAFNTSVVELVSPRAARGAFEPDAVLNDFIGRPDGSCHHRGLRQRVAELCLRVRDRNSVRGNYAVALRVPC